MGKTNHKDGDYISLSWDTWDGYPEEVYVHGHVTPELFWEVMDIEQYGDVEHTETRHAYGRYVFHGVDDWGDTRRILRVYEEPGKGRFKLTAAKYQRKPVITY